MILVYPHTDGIGMAADTRRRASTFTIECREMEEEEQKRKEKIEKEENAVEKESCCTVSSLYGGGNKNEADEAVEMESFETFAKEFKTFAETMRKASDERFEKEMRLISENMRLMERMEEIITKESRNLSGDKDEYLGVVRKLEADVVSPGEERRMIPNNAEVDEEVVTPIPREVDGAGETWGIISNDEDGVWLSLIHI